MKTQMPLYTFRQDKLSFIFRGKFIFCLLLWSLSINAQITVAGGADIITTEKAFIFIRQDADARICISKGTVVYSGDTQASRIPSENKDSFSKNQSVQKKDRVSSLSKKKNFAEKEAHTGKSKPAAHASIKITSGSDSALENLIRQSCTQCVLSNTNPATKTFLNKIFVFRFPERPVLKTVFNKDLNSIRLSQFSGEAFSIRPPPVC